MFKILIINDDPVVRLMRSMLASHSYQIDGVVSLEEASERTRQNGPYGAIFFDAHSSIMKHPTVLDSIREMNPHAHLVTLASSASPQHQPSALRNAGWETLPKPFDAQKLAALLSSMTETGELAEPPHQAAPCIHFDDGKQMIGESAAIRRVFDLIEKLAKVETSVLIRGESGTGKELVAQALHYNSPRKKGPFVAVNCGAIPENLIESELFGHERGAFTSADKRKIGKFQYAAGGTIFLDEIGDISLPMQVKLLRVLQEKKFTPVGSNVEIDADVRIISATNRNLEKHILEERFRPDLFYRINVLPINLPPLRERREDIKRLVTFMIEKFNGIHRKNIKGMDRDTLGAMQSYNWPGNIRELENVIEHAFIMEATDRIGIASLPQYLQSSPDAASLASGTQVAPAGMCLISEFAELNYPVLKERFEKEFIQRALRAFGGRINQTAEHTQMTKVTLMRKLEKYQINPRDFRLD